MKRQNEKWGRGETFCLNLNNMACFPRVLALKSGHGDSHSSPLPCGFVHECNVTGCCFLTSNFRRSGHFPRRVPGPIGAGRALGPGPGTQ